jgi:hypothetical protein
MLRSTFCQFARYSCPRLRISSDAPRLRMKRPLGHLVCNNRLKPRRPHACNSASMGSLSQLGACHVSGCRQQLHHGGATSTNTYWATCCCALHWRACCCHCMRRLDLHAVPASLGVVFQCGVVLPIRIVALQQCDILQHDKNKSALFDPQMVPRGLPCSSASYNCVADARSTCMDCRFQRIQFMALAEQLPRTSRLASSALVPLTSFQASHLARASSCTAHGWEPCRRP